MATFRVVLDFLAAVLTFDHAFFQSMSCDPIERLPHVLIMLVLVGMSVWFLRLSGFFRNRPSAEKRGSWRAFGRWTGLALSVALILPLPLAVVEVVIYGPQCGKVKEREAVSQQVVNNRPQAPIYQQFGPESRMTITYQTVIVAGSVKEIDGLLQSLTDPGMLDFRLYLLFGETSWQFKSDTTFVNDAKTRGFLSSGAFRKVLDSYDTVLCVGLASNKDQARDMNRPRAFENAVRLSETRAENLCGLARDLNGVRGKPLLIATWLGENTRTYAGDEDEMRQRPSIILAIRHARGSLATYENRRRIVDQMLHSNKYLGFEPGEYSIFVDRVEKDTKLCWRVLNGRGSVCDPAKSVVNEY